MVYRGHVKDGVVIFDDSMPPEGASVRVEVAAPETVPPAAPTASVWARLRKYAGAVNDLPSDMARNHDHYIHGAPKR